MAAASAQERVGQILKFKVLMQQFLDHLLAADCASALRVLEKADKIVSCHFQPEQKIDLARCRAILVESEAKAVGFAEELAALVPVGFAVEAVGMEGKLQLAFASEGCESQMYRRMQENCQFFYGALERLTVEEAARAFNALAEYLSVRVGSVSCVFCNRILAFQNQIEGFVPPMVPFWIGNGELAVVHSTCLKKNAFLASD